jgi:hypothetical protein
MNRASRTCLAVYGLLALGIIATPRLAGAAPPPPSEVTVSQVPFDDDFDACGGERVRVSGIQTVVSRVSQDGSGRWHYGFTRSTRGTGVGQVSGASYVLNGAVSRASLEVTPGEPRVYTEQYSARLIRKGENATPDDSYVHFLGTITVNANGEVTATVSIQRVDCR